jgi:hypothetical protein
MSLSKEERSAINKVNASKAKGPVSDTGKQISKRNATKHGLTARQVTLPDDDPAEIQALFDRWDDFYNPQTPSQEHLVEQCVFAALLQKRVARSHCAAVADQVNRAEMELDERREKELRETAAVWSTSPKEAVAGLMRSAWGLEFLLTRWEHLGRVLRESGSWAADEEAEVIRLLGLVVEPGRGNPDLLAHWTVRFHNDLCRHGAKDHRVKFFLDPARCPASMRDHYEKHELPGRDECFTKLTGLVEQNLAVVRERLDRARPVAEAERLTCRERALTLRDEREARLMIRYQSEARLAFHRAYDALMKSLKEGAGDVSTDRGVMADRQAAPAETTAHEKQPQEGAGEAPKAAEDVEARNEPNSAATPLIIELSAANSPPPRPAAPALKGERLLNSLFADPFEPAGGVDVFQVPVWKGSGAAKKG